MTEGWKHLYGVLGTPDHSTFDTSTAGDQDEAAYLVTYKELSAMVRNTCFMGYKGAPKDDVMRHLFDHQKTIEQVMDSYPILPFKFGSLAHTEKEVKQILIQGYPLFKSLLPWVRERMELDLVATWEREKVFKALYEEESEIRSLQETIRKPSGKDVLLEKIELGALVSKSLKKRRSRFKEQILSHLKGCTESQSDHEVMDDFMILNMGFLLRREMESEFNQRVQDLDQTFLGEVSFKLIGPLPLYSFRCIKIEWTDPQKVREALALFGLTEKAPFAEIRKAYYQKVHSLHPDKRGDRFTSLPEFEKVVAAYRLLRKYYQDCHSLSGEERVLSIEVKTNGSNT
jgi:DnaJ-domain-containing protein 1